MALGKSTFKFTSTRSFKDGEADVIGVALVDGQGDHAGTVEAPLSTRSASEELLCAMLVELRILNRHMSEIRDETFTAEDL